MQFRWDHLKGFLEIHDAVFYKLDRANKAVVVPTWLGTFGSQDNGIVDKTNMAQELFQVYKRSDNKVDKSAGAPLKQWTQVQTIHLCMTSLDCLQVSLVDAQLKGFLESMLLNDGGLGPVLYHPWTQGDNSNKFFLSQT